MELHPSQIKVLFEWGDTRRNNGLLFSQRMLDWDEESISQRGTKGVLFSRSLHLFFNDSTLSFSTLIISLYRCLLTWRTLKYIFFKNLFTGSHFLAKNQRSFVYVMSIRVFYYLFKYFVPFSLPLEYHTLQQTQAICYHPLATWEEFTKFIGNLCDHYLAHKKRAK